MKVVNTYFIRKHRHQHQMALAVSRGRKFTTCIFMEYPLHVERVVNSEADKFTELEQHGQMKKLPTPDRQVKQVIKILQIMALLYYKNKIVMPKNLKTILF